MTGRRLWRQLTFGLILTVMLPVTAWAQGNRAQVEWALSRGPVGVGDALLLQIAVTDSEAQPTVLFPNVPGLRFESEPSVSPSSSISIINGRHSERRTLTYTYRIVAERPGVIRIPDFSFVVDRQRRIVTERLVEVIDYAAQFSELIFLELTIPDGTIYAGQAVDATLTLWVADVRVQRVGVPDFSGGGFTASLGEEPRQERLGRGNRTYDVVRWPVRLVALRSGTVTPTYDLAVQVEMAGSRRDFFGRGQSRVLNLETDADSVEVLPLPQPIPEGFTQGIGRFQIASQLLGTDVQVGAPVTLEVELSGQGNFERIVPPEPASTEEWVFYSPEVDVSASGFRISYPMAPQSVDITETPTFPFIVFDPNLGQYQELSVPSFPVDVAPGIAAVLPETTTVERVASDPDRQPLPIQLAPGLRGSLASIQPGAEFWVAQGGLGLALTGFLFWRRRVQHLEANPEVRAWHEARRRFDRAQRSGGAEGLLTALQIGVAWRLRGEPEAVTPAVVRQQLSDSFDADLVDRLTQFAESQLLTRYAASAEATNASQSFTIQPEDVKGLRPQRP